MRPIRFRLTRLCLIRLCLVTLLFASALGAHAQGCSMCRDTTAGSTPNVRKALRRGIFVLGIPAGAIFLGILVVAKRMKRLEDAPGAPRS